MCQIKDFDFQMVMKQIGLCLFQFELSDPEIRNGQ
jgi:hypothetical protein